MNILDYIDVWLLWKSIGLHALTDDANAFYPSTPIRPVLWPGDLVIGHLTLKINRALYSATMHLCMKCQSIHGQNVTISFKHKYRRHTLTSRCDVICDVMNTKNTFYVIICDVLSICDVKMNLCEKYFENFKMAAILRFGRVFKPGVVPEVESYTKIGHVIPYILRFCSTF